MAKWAGFIDLGESASERDVEWFKKGWRAAIENAADDIGQVRDRPEGWALSIAIGLILMGVASAMLVTL